MTHEYSNIAVGVFESGSGNGDAGTRPVLPIGKRDGWWMEPVITTLALRRLRQVAIAAGTAQRACGIRGTDPFPPVTKILSLNT